MLRISVSSIEILLNSSYAIAKKSHKNRKQRWGDRYAEAICLLILLGDGPRAVYRLATEGPIDAITADHLAEVNLGALPVIQE